MIKRLLNTAYPYPMPTTKPKAPKFKFMWFAPSNIGHFASVTVYADNFNEANDKLVIAFSCSRADMVRKVQGLSIVVEEVRE